MEADEDEYPEATELELRVAPEFVHRPLAATALGVDETLSIGRLSNQIVQATIAQNIEDVRVAAISGQLGQLSGRVVAIRGGFYFRLGGEEANQRVQFHADLKVDKAVTLAVDGEFDPSRFEANSPRDNLRGRKHMYIVGVARSVNLNPLAINIRPLLIGDPYFVAPGTPGAPMFAPDRPEVFASDIDQFGLDEDAMRRRVPESELQRLYAMPEQVVKAAFADILGLTTIPKDWGGEHSDLVAEVSIRRSVHRAAFALKGPAGKKRPWMLHPADMGKRGDQAMRLFLEPADIFVVQHCSTISEQVRHLLDALASHHRKRYMMLTGEHTVRILNHAGLLG